MRPNSAMLEEKVIKYGLKIDILFGVVTQNLILHSFLPDHLACGLADLYRKTESFWTLIKAEES